MPIPKSHKVNLKTIIRAAKAGALCIVDCQDRLTGKSIAVLCAVEQDGGEYSIVPFAKMSDGNPYDELNPPNPDGGYLVEA